MTKINSQKKSIDTLISPINLTALQYSVKRVNSNFFIIPPLVTHRSECHALLFLLNQLAVSANSIKRSLKLERARRSFSTFTGNLSTWKHLTGLHG